ncbi:serine hydrolase [Maribacter sp. ANRC-HE7]|uniref:Serine hydrolase n=1 Tax=Maribacter aquimaris TaxID=2737171 RepID=A0ABR7V313_9FLAO|nr:serine hydrolase [Maribacter aquimaris]MBD0779204.1 serine hydrolase [Maribacter aquimaris]
MIQKTLPFLIIMVFSTACKKPPQYTNALDYALASKDLKIKRVIDSLDSYEVQIKFTKIIRAGDSVIFEDHDFQVNDTNYFYPASTIKLPIAALTLEKLNHMDSLHRNTRFYVEGDTMETTFASDIMKIFTISDNAANNRLFEFLGQDAINGKLKQKGIDAVRISHRLSSDDAYEITTKPLVVYLNDSTTTMLKNTINTSAIPLDMNKIHKGKAYYDDEDGLVDEPFDFSLKNYYPINAQHNVLKRIVFPECFDPSERFDLSTTQRDFLLEAMQTLPREAGYDPKEYYDSYVKFLMYGDSKAAIPDYIKIRNKVGYAYGTLTDCAYIHDPKNNVEFLLTATILVNEDGIFNDNVYEYDSIGIPFLATLGKEIYNYGLQSKKD